MKHLLSYKIFEKIQLGRIYLKDYNFISDNDNEGYLEVISKEDKKYRIEVKIIGTDEKGKEIKEGKTIRIFYPESEMKIDMNLLEKIVYIFNKNRLGYTFNIQEVVNPSYGLKPFGLLTVNNDVDITDLEKIIASTKTVNNIVKKGGGLDQFTF